MHTASRKERLEAVEDVIGTHRAEGIALDATVRRLMDQFVDGELTLAQFSAAMDVHAESIMSKSRQMAGAV
jgi:Antitoxin VbhA